jgi:hypothetical protein
MKSIDQKIQQEPETSLVVGNDVDEPNESRTCKQKMRMSSEELQRAAK